MQDVDRPAYVQRLPQPARGRGPRVQGKSLGLVPRSKHLHRIAGYFWRTRDLGQESAVRATEPKRAVRLSIELVALFVDSAVVTATEHGEIRQRGGAALGPVADVMALAEWQAAARKAAAAIAMMERAP